MSDSIAQRRKNKDSDRLKTAVSVCPAGEDFPLALEADYQQEWKRLQKLANEQRLLGREIVVVMGLGFAGAVMAAVVANAQDDL